MSDQQQTTSRALGMPDEICTFSIHRQEVYPEISSPSLAADSKPATEKSKGVESRSLLRPLSRRSETIPEPSGGMTALHLAIGSGTNDSIQRLLEAGADPNFADDIGVTPLMEAVYYGSECAVRLLLDAGAIADIHKPYDLSQWPKLPTTTVVGGDWRASRDFALRTFIAKSWCLLHIAVWRGDYSILELLLAQKISQWSMRTPLDLAIDLNRLDMCLLLLRHHMTY
ncbi:ankyrin repeat-containing domain protein [Boeremia exigua]|uniref:ankyrin repeat-containing domain protein n=1 Tax=Boeremia exigua TaxID=749465 RepID=UPI001E8DCEC9|nr:ankyrin repeat-containing domain protein [Boeremia exigua]KAH6613884.1 ankyrin repeat-containing domain protein [Boeremia exigua]